jgi:hypothetical protein
MSAREEKIAKELERRATELRARSEEGLSVREAVALAAVQLGMSPESEYEARRDIRFWEQVKKLRTRCWEWQGRKSPDGYGTFSVEGRAIPAHRYAYESRVGQIPHGLVIDHLCRNPSCVKPQHLEPVTPRENWLRGVSPSAREARRREAEESVESE